MQVRMPDHAKVAMFMTYQFAGQDFNFPTTVRKENELQAQYEEAER